MKERRVPSSKRTVRRARAAATSEPRPVISLDAETLEALRQEGLKARTALERHFRKLYTITAQDLKFVLK